jgi:hypothetical protein
MKTLSSPRRLQSVPCGRPILSLVKGRQPEDLFT